MLISIENYLFEKIFKVLMFIWSRKIFSVNNYKVFTGEQDVKIWGAKDNQFFSERIKYRENGVACETDLMILESFDHYAGCPTFIINKILRGEQIFGSKKYYFKYIRTITKTINDFSLPSNVIAVRKTESRYFEKIKQNSSYVEKGFLSASLNIFHRPDESGHQKKIKNEAILVLMIPIGTKAVYIEEAQTIEKRRKEYELLLQKGSKILIHRNFKVFSNRIILGKVEQPLLNQHKNMKTERIKHFFEHLSRQGGLLDIEKSVMMKWREGVHGVDRSEIERINQFSLRFSPIEVKHINSHIEVFGDGKHYTDCTDSEIYNLIFGKPLLTFYYSKGETVVFYEFEFDEKNIIIACDSITDNPWWYMNISLNDVKETFKKPRRISYS